MCVEKQFIFFLKNERSCYIMLNIEGGSKVPDIERQNEPTLKKGEKTRETVVALAADIASLEGLEGLTIGRLARETGMSKSGLFAHFGSKEELQLATLERAREVFLREVVEPSHESPEGLPRLYAMFMNWLGYVERSVFRGGCFFSAASAEFDGRPGKVRDKVAALTRYWRDLIEEEADRAAAVGDVEESTDAALLAFQLHGLVQEANWASQLLEDPEAFAQARRAAEKMLRAVATPQGVRKSKARRVVPAVTASTDSR